MKKNSIIRKNEIKKIKDKNRKWNKVGDEKGSTNNNKNLTISIWFKIFPRFFWHFWISSSILIFFNFSFVLSFFPDWFPISKSFLISFPISSVASSNSRTDNRAIIGHWINGQKIDNIFDKPEFWWYMKKFWSKLRKVKNKKILGKKILGKKIIFGQKFFLSN